MHRVAVLIAVASLVAVACGSSRDGSLQFGVRRLALNIAFVDEDAAPPVEPEVVVRLVPAPPETLEPGFDFRSVQVQPDAPPPALPEPPPELLCPSASPEATIGLSASPSVIDPVEAGTYLRDNSGTVVITGAGLPLQLPYPFLTAWKVAEPTEVERVATPLDPSEGSFRQFSITKEIAPGFVTTETYEIGNAALLLIERVVVANGNETRFRTEPPLEFFRFGAEGDSWTSAGVDRENGFAVVIQGSIADREVIDVCGELVDTFVIEYTERVVNLENGETTGTDPDEVSIINFAPQFGGLAVRETMHITQRTETEDGTPVLIEFDYVSTLTSIGPADV